MQKRATTTTCPALRDEVTKLKAPRDGYALVKCEHAVFNPEA